MQYNSHVAQELDANIVHFNVNNNHYQLKPKSTKGAFTRAANAHHRNNQEKPVVDLAYEMQDWECLLLLIENGSPFPNNFNIKDIPKSEDNLVRYIERNNVSIYNLANMSEQVSLKPGEFESLFYLSRGFSNKEIARRKHIAYRTLSYHIDELKAKFHVSTVAELVIKAIASGYVNSLPKNLFTKQLVIIIQDYLPMCGLVK